jgi:hypothetical protein
MQIRRQCLNLLSKNIPLNQERGRKMKAYNVKKMEQDMKMNFDVKVKQRLENLIGKRVRFCLKNNSYDSIIHFEAGVAGVHLQKQSIKIGSSEVLDFAYTLENDKGVEIKIPMRHFVRIEETDTTTANAIFLVFERHFWSLEVVP